MKLSVSNIAWGNEQDTEMLKFLADSGYSGIEIAPTRVIAENPYDNISKAKSFLATVTKLGLTVPSMQSIWYGRSERVFAAQDERDALLNYTKKTIDFAKALNCGNLVFGSPKNRVLSDASDEEAGRAMFREVADYAAQNGTVFAVEANPAIYNTNYINYTKDAFELAKRMASEGFKVNLDVGTIIENKEDLDAVARHLGLVNHVHVSEPYLAPPQKRTLHSELANLLKTGGYAGYVSIEMKNPGDLSVVKDVMAYVGEVFN